MHLVALNGTPQTTPEDDTHPLSMHHLQWVHPELPVDPLHHHKAPVHIMIQMRVQVTNLQCLQPVTANSDPVYPSATTKPSWRNYMAAHKSEHSTHSPYHCQTQAQMKRKKTWTLHSTYITIKYFNVNTSLLLRVLPIMSNCTHLFSFQDHFTSFITIHLTSL